MTTRIAPHASGLPNDDVLGQKIVAIVQAPDYGDIRILLSNGMEILPYPNTDMSVWDAGVEYPLSKWVSRFREKE